MPLASNTWTLTGNADACAGLELLGFRLESAGFGATLNPTSFTGNGSATLTDTLVDPGDSIDVALTFTFDHTHIHAGGHADVDHTTIGSVVFLDQTDVDAAFDAAVGGALTGSVSVTAGVAVLFPTTTVVNGVPAGPITGHTLSGSLSPSGRIELTADDIDGTFGNGAITFSVANAAVILGGDATDPLFAAAHVTAHLPALGNLSIALDGLHLGADHKFGASQVTVGSTGFAEALDLAGILPFDITSASATFPDHDDLDRFDVTVTGHFDFAPLASLPFTPKVKLGTNTFITPNTPTDQNQFTFSVAVDSLSEGRVRPLDFGPLGLGFDDLTLGDISVSADISLGGYQNGVFQDTFGGNVSLAGDFGDVQGALTAAVTGRLDVGTDQTTLAVAGTFGVSLKIGDGFELENADLSFALGLTVDAASHVSVTGPTLQGADIDRSVRAPRRPDEADGARRDARPRAARERSALARRRRRRVRRVPTRPRSTRRLGRLRRQLRDRPELPAGADARLRGRRHRAERREARTSRLPAVAHRRDRHPFPEHRPRALAAGRFRADRSRRLRAAVQWWHRGQRPVADQRDRRRARVRPRQARARRVPHHEPRRLLDGDRAVRAVPRLQDRRRPRARHDRRRLRSRPGGPHRESVLRPRLR